MKFRKRSLLLFLAPALLVPVLLVSCNKPASPPPSASSSEIDPVHGHLLHAQPRLPTVTVWLGDQELIAEVARTDVQIATGMMFRTNMAENEAMLFVFRNAAPRSFYMRNCFVPLSGAYMSPSGEILEIIQMQPHNETGIESKSRDIQFVLEVPQGWFDRHHLGVGTVVRTKTGTLQQTFFPPR